MSSSSFFPNQLDLQHSTSATSFEGEQRQFSVGSGVEDEGVSLGGLNSQSVFTESNEGRTILFSVIQVSSKSKELEVKRFNSLIESRKAYLGKLTSLTNWISGRSESPSSLSINISEKILDAFKSWINANKEIPIPKIVMGPVPSGGICIELKANQSNGLLLTIANQGEIDLDVMVDDFFTSMKLDENKINHLMISTYESIPK